MPTVLHHREKALTVAEYGRELAATLDDAIITELPHDAELLTIYAHRLRLCNNPGNIWTATDLHNDTGELFEGNGRFWHCGSKLCPYCLSKTSKANRKQLRAAIEEQQLLVGEHYHFITLTMPNLGIPLLEARRIMNLAWSLFRKRQWFKQTIIGGCKSEEFTFTKRGYHYHTHVLVRSRYVNFSSLRHFWTEALSVAFARSGRDLSIATSDGLAIANCQRVRSLQDAIQEVAKYVTKTSSWKKIPTADLLDVCRIRRFPRMFEFFGSFRLSCRVACGEQIDADLNKTILDTGSLSDGETAENWRDTVTHGDAVAYLDRLHEQFHDAFAIRREQLIRKYPFATFRRCKPPPYSPEHLVLGRLQKLRELREAINRPPQIWRIDRYGVPQRLS